MADPSAIARRNRWSRFQSHKFPDQRKIKMQRNHNIDSIKVNSLLTVIKKIKVNRPNKNVYSWADGLFRSGFISASLLHTLKAIISCTPLQQPTIQQINAARNKSASKKFAQDDNVSDRTIRRHIQDLEKLKLVEVTRTRDARRNSRNAYSVKVPDDVLSCSSEDTMSASLCTPDPKSKINTKTDHLKPNLGLIFKSERAAAKAKRTPAKDKQSLNEHQLRQLAIMVSMGTWEHVAVGWLLTYPEYKINDAIQEVKMKAHTRPGGYMRTILEGLDQRKAEQQSKPKHPTTPGLVATGITLEPPRSSAESRKIGKVTFADIKQKLSTKTGDK